MPPNVEVEASISAGSGAGPVKTIAAPASSSAVDDLVVALRAAGLDERRDPGVERELRPVREREEGVRGEHRALERVAELARLLDRDPHRVHPAHLPRPDSEGLAPRASTIAFDVTCLTTRHAKRRSSHCSSGDLAAHDLASLATGRLAVAILDEEAAEHAPIVALGLVEGALIRVLEDAQRRPCLRGARAPAARTPARTAPRRTASRAPRPSAAVTGAIDDDDASVRGDRIGGESLRVRLLDRVGDGDSARVRVLHDDAGRAVELAGEQPRRREVAEVVERQRLALVLLDEAEEMRARAPLGVVGRALMRVLAVRELEHAVERRDERLREVVESRWNQRAIAASYAADRANAIAASRRRSSGVVAPLRPQLVEHRRRSPRARTTTVTDAKFFAAARSSAGPPTSIISMSSASSSSGRSTASSNG